MKTSPWEISPGTYLNLLKAIECELPEMLSQTSAWNSVDVNYALPRVERLWMQRGEYRIYLHRIHPTKADKTFFHQHPWPSAMRILSGQYEMGLGYGQAEPSPVISTLELSERDCYEMVQPYAWHYVCPIHSESYSLMIAGPPWLGRERKSALSLEPLNVKAKAEIISFFRSCYT